MKQNKRPLEDSAVAETDKVAKAPMPFADKAARLSCYLIWAAYVLAGVAQQSFLLMMIILSVATFIAFALGAIGIIGGFERGSLTTIGMASLGTLMSGMTICLLIFFAFSYGVAPTEESKALEADSVISVERKEAPQTRRTLSDG